MLENIVDNHMYTTTPPKVDGGKVEEYPQAPDFIGMTSFEIGLLYEEIFHDELKEYEDLIFI